MIELPGQFFGVIREVTSVRGNRVLGGRLVIFWTGVFGT